jgi:hypothetical protein
MGVENRSSNSDFRIWKNLGKLKRLQVHLCKPSQQRRILMLYGCFMAEGPMVSHRIRCTLSMFDLSEYQQLMAEKVRFLAAVLLFFKPKWKLGRASRKT